MRRYLLLGAPAVVAAFLFACEDDSATGGGPGINLPDGGGFDAATSFDANVPDTSSPDGTAPILPVTVVVSSFTGTPVANVSVVFHDGNGAVIETKTTGADGKVVSGTSPLPSMATAVFAPEGDDRQLLTWTGIQSGDVLPAVTPVTTTLAEVQITLPGQYDGAGGPTSNYYAKVGGCEAYSTIPNEPISVFLQPYCYSGSGAVLVVGADGTDTPVAHASKKPLLAPVDGGAIQVTTDDWSSPPKDVAVSITNTTDSSGQAWLNEIANSTAFYDQRPLGDTYATTFHAAGGSFAEAYSASVAFGTNFSGSRVLGKRVAPTDAITFDANELPTPVTSASVDATSAKRPVANWVGDMSTMKGGLVRFSWYDNSTERSTDWTVVVSPNAAATGSATAPALPASFDGLLPEPDGGATTWRQTPDVYFATSDLLPDYAAWRKLQGVILTSSVLRSGRVERAVLPQNGSFKITGFHPALD